MIEGLVTEKLQVNEWKNKKNKTKKAQWNAHESEMIYARLRLRLEQTHTHIWAACKWVQAGRRRDCSHLLTYLRSDWLRSKWHNRPWEKINGGIKIGEFWVAWNHGRETILKETYLFDLNLKFCFNILINLIPKIWGHISKPCSTYLICSFGYS